MTITIDCRMYDSSGIGVYLRGCLPYFLQSDNNFLLIGNSVQLKSFLTYKNVKIINCDVKTFSLKELLFFPYKLLKIINKTDLFYSPFFNIPCGITIPVFTTIHDIIFPDMPELTSKIGLLVRMWFFRRAYKLSKKIFTVSNFSKSRIEHHLGSSKPVIVTYSAIQTMFLEYKANTQKKEIIVYIGNIKKHKGLDYLLDAFYIAKKDGLTHQLLIIGSRENFRSSDTDILKKIDLIGNNSVLFTGFISDEELMAHLSCAALLVQPSLYEGFCLPPLEAMVLGTHALVSDIPVLKEVYSEFPVTYFKNGNSIDLKDKLIELLHKKTFTNITLTEKLKYKYTFDKTVSIILEALKK
ncbi:MAG: glycosyltransferase family 4 protein [Treponema sp.]|nr:glycosyltransferase family 4 protein [Treponema sp.]MCL2250393.1 glycosyltransferase family 4 protein [Treponema sp.]